MRRLPLLVLLIPSLWLSLALVRFISQMQTNALPRAAPAHEGNGNDHIAIAGRESVINVQDYGAKGDWFIDNDHGPPYGSGTDDTAAVQAIFGSLPRVPKHHASMNAVIPSTKTIYFPRGVYHCRGPIFLGAPGTEVIARTALCSEGAMIHIDMSGYNAGDFGLTITNLWGCTIRGLNVQVLGASGLSMDSIADCDVDHLSVASDGMRMLDLRGVVMNNTWTGIRLGQNNTHNSDTATGLYVDCTIPTQTVWSNFVINSIDGLFIAGCKYAIFLKGVDNLSIQTIEAEGLGAGPAIHLIGAHRVHIDGVYSELTPNNVPLWRLDRCNRIILDNVHGASYYHYVDINDCNFVTLRNYGGGGRLQLYGLNRGLLLENCEFRANACRQLFNSAVAQDAADVHVPYSGVIGLKADNLRIIGTTTDIEKGFFQIDPDGFDSTDNRILNPRGLSSLRNVTTYRCAVVDDPRHTDVSPLGYRESLVTVTSSTTFPYLEFDLDSSRLTKASTQCTLYVAMKYLPVSPIAALKKITALGTSMPSVNGSQRNYGDLLLYSGEWLISVTELAVPAGTATSGRIVWNYNQSYEVGAQFLFGGAVLVPGHRVKLP
jgi:hypothetical protein